MGSFKSAGARAADQATLTVDDRPEKVDPSDWLQPGETITYWTRLPHGFAADIADAATTAVVQNRSARRGGANVQAAYHPGKAALATFILGIVSFALRDENDQPVAIELPTVGTPGWEARAKAFMSGLPGPLANDLQLRIGADSPAGLDEPAEDAKDEADTVGNG